MDTRQLLASFEISIHALREEGDVMTSEDLLDEEISIHALREEGDMASVALMVRHMGFLSTPSARRATVCNPPQSWIYFISIHALREEGDATKCCTVRYRQNISIHALREEGDRYGGELSAQDGAISIHALREEGDVPFFLRYRCHTEFLSTPSARRATVYKPAGSVAFAISIHALREEGDLLLLLGGSGAAHISIHALREEGDLPLSAPVLWQA